MPNAMTVSRVAKLAHVTVRTLHHYDEIGLLPPSERTAAGYRVYTQADLERLQQILLYRELGFALEAIGQVLDQPAIDRRSALEAQRALLEEKKQRTEAVIRAVERTLTIMEEGGTMSGEELFEGFEALGDAPEHVRAHHAEHAQETKARWGEASPYRESMRRVKSYSKDDWKRIEAETEANERRMVELLESGAEPEGEAAMAAAEAMRAHISDWYYPCGYEVHASLADMYEQDPRFRAHYEDRAAGLASFVASAIRANAVRGSA